MPPQERAIIEELSTLHRALAAAQEALASAQAVVARARNLTLESVGSGSAGAPRERRFSSRAKTAEAMGVSTRYVAAHEHEFPPGSVVRQGRLVRYDIEAILAALGDATAREVPSIGDPSADGATWIRSRMAVRGLPDGRK